MRRDFHPCPSTSLKKLLETTAFPSSQRLAQIVLYITAVRINPKGDKTRRQIIFGALLMLVLVGTNVACNTIHGMGQDVERAGEKTQDAADAVKKKM
jgi:predicted small secreted protein